MKRFTLLTVLLTAALSCFGQTPDTLRVLAIGNSFTYVGDTPAKLKELSTSEGHVMIVKSETVGGFTFSRHLQRDKTLKALELPAPASHFDWVFLQNQSQLHARYGEAPRKFPYVLADAKELAGRVRQYSPDARIVIESTWSYPAGNCGGFGSLERFDRLNDKGTLRLAKACKAEVSYIGRAFARARTECPDIDLLDKDRKHQSEYGAYLKTCVNYLLIYGTPFSDHASACGLDPQAAGRLRKVAERSVLGQ